MRGSTPLPPAQEHNRLSLPVASRSSKIAIALDRIRDGRAAKSVLLVGLRGTGKTVLLNRLKKLGFDLVKEDGLADSGDLDHDLTELFLTIGEVAKDRITAVVVFIDELQCVAESQLASLISALHACSQKQLQGNHRYHKRMLSLLHNWRSRN